MTFHSKVAAAAIFAGAAGIATIVPAHADSSDCTGDITSISCPTILDLDDWGADYLADYAEDAFASWSSALTSFSDFSLFSTYSYSFGSAFVDAYAGATNTFGQIWLSFLANPDNSSPFQVSVVFRGVTYSYEDALDPPGVTTEKTTRSLHPTDAIQFTLPGTYELSETSGVVAVPGPEVGSGFAVMAVLAGLLGYRRWLAQKAA